MRLAALLVNLAGMLLLFAAWRRRGRRWPLALVGWAALIGAWALWRGISGPEFASVYVVIATALIAWALIFYNRQNKPIKTVAKMPYRPFAFNGAGWWHGLVRLLVAGPLAAFASLALGLLAVSSMPCDPANRLAGGAFMFLLAWTLMACWACAAARLRRPALVLVLIAGICIGLARALGE